MKNPFMESVDESLFLFIPGISDKQAEYAANAINQHEKLVAERDDLKRYVDKLPTYCAYCGFEVPIDDEAASKISEHIATCPKHPMRIIEAALDECITDEGANCYRLRDPEEMVKALRRRLEVISCIARAAIAPAKTEGD